MSHVYKTTPVDFFVVQTSKATTCDDEKEGIRASNKAASSSTSPPLSPPSPPQRSTSSNMNGHSGGSNSSDADVGVDKQQARWGKGERINLGCCSRKCNNAPSFLRSSHHPLFSHGVCRWTGCETPLQGPSEFRRHLEREHVLNDRSTAQTRVQVQIVSQLKLQLKKEEDRLEAMMRHLHPREEAATDEDGQEEEKGRRRQLSPKGRGGGKQRSSPSAAVMHLDTFFGGLGGGGAFPGMPSTERQSPPPAQPPSRHHQLHHHVSAPAPPPPPLLQNGLVENGGGGRGGGGRRFSEQKAPKLSLPPYMEDSPARMANGGGGGRGEAGGGGGRGGSGLDPENEIARNRDFYRTQDVRPPFTYAALIRQVTTIGFLFS